MLSLLAVRHGPLWYHEAAWRAAVSAEGFRGLPLSAGAY